MRGYFKSAASLVLIPLTRWYLRKERTYVYRDTAIRILPGVFHPGLFTSTKFILDFLLGQDLRRKTLLELGCGSGLISVMAAKAGALVTASDVSLNAVNNAYLNAEQNNVALTIVKSDLFDQLGGNGFDWIIINPPYYAREPKSEAELAWNCGETFGYFEKLFSQLTTRAHAGSFVLMVLTKGCDIQRITSIGNAHGFRFEKIREKRALFDEKDFLFRIVKV